ncbi:trypsin-like peptidase domain-containing protein [Candidatus Pacearchaeota archaeon]|nr:hypothetical protein [uncultured archaeon]AQS34679.1 hypothetical protein [uncultured archaeon]MBS3084410.1 trypsin-like peptidase domain-containing protein [Candidatus Pacearchaeota archaeon]
MKTHHKIILGSFSTIMVISVIAIAIILNGVIVKQTLENDALKQKISELQSSTDEKINELTSEVIETKSSFNQKITSLNDNLSSTNELISKLKIQSGEDFSEVIKKVIGSIVIIRTFSEQGSGFFIADGYLATNKHVLEDKNGDISNVIQIITNDNKVHSGTLIGYIKDLDLALIKTNSDYRHLTLGSSQNVGIGEKVLAIGTPEGLSFSATDGIVSAVNRTGFGTIGSYIQTNAELNPGNSGGPLLNKNGEVIGMNNFKIAEAEGIGFALEADKIKLGINTISKAVLNETLIDY